MKTTRIQKGFVLLAVASAMSTAACELIVDFDRTRIPVEVSEASIPDGSFSDVSVPGEGGSDASADADATTADASDASDAATDG
jgi:hypothetical protein